MTKIAEIQWSIQKENERGRISKLNYCYLIFIKYKEEKKYEESPYW